MKKNRKYAGVGPREIGISQIEEIYRLARELARKGLTLRTGGAEGSDEAFECGARDGEGAVELYLPWKNFRGKSGVLEAPTPEAYEIAKEFLPHWEKLKPGAKKLYARNVHVILGKHLNDPVEFVIYGGNGETPGTAHTLRVAKALGIPCVSVNDPAGIKELL